MELDFFVEKETYMRGEKWFQVGYVAEGFMYRDKGYEILFTM